MYLEIHVDGLKRFVSRNVFKSKHDGEENVSLMRVAQPNPRWSISVKTGYGAKRNTFLISSATR
jgi:hypothetical protein